MLCSLVFSLSFPTETATKGLFSLGFTGRNTVITTDIVTACVLPQQLQNLKPSQLGFKIYKLTSSIDILCMNYTYSITKQTIKRGNLKSISNLALSSFILLERRRIPYHTANKRRSRLIQWRGERTSPATPWFIMGDRIPTTNSFHRLQSTTHIRPSTPATGNFLMRPHVLQKISRYLSLTLQPRRCIYPPLPKSYLHSHLP